MMAVDSDISYPDGGTPSNTYVPAGWPRKVIPLQDKDPNGPPGAPIQYYPPMSNETAEPGFAYEGAGQIEESGRYFYHGDHLGSTSFVTDARGRVSQYVAYMPYGEALFEEHSNTRDMPYLFNAKERDEETGLYYYGARYLDPETAVWYGVDPMTMKHPDYSPYAYVYNNPVGLIDPFGLDSAQRAQAVALAHEYVANNPGNSWQSGGRGAPGQGVDCSGMVSNTIIAGEEPDPYIGRNGNGVSRIVQASEQVTDNNNIETGNVVVLDNSATGTTNPQGHIGIITEVTRDDNGNVTGYRIADSGGRPSTGVSGPRYTDITIGGDAYWDSRITGVYRWDTRPDVVNGGTLPAVTVQGQGPTYIQPITPTLIRR